MAANMHVELVAADRRLWSGEATVVNTRTLAGEIGIMANHTPLLSVLAPGQVDVRTADEGHWVAAIDGGFISVANNRVTSCASARRSPTRATWRRRAAASRPRRRGSPTNKPEAGGSACRWTGRTSVRPVHRSAPRGRR